MQFVSFIERLDVTIRSQICTVCTQRPAGSESLNARTPRSCQPTCPIFGNLHTLVRVTQTLDNRSLNPHEVAAKDLVCATCKANPAAIDFTCDRATRTCPLSRHMGDVVNILQRLNEQL